MSVIILSIRSLHRRHIYAYILGRSLIFVINVINISGTWVVWISIDVCTMENILITVRYVLKHSDWRVICRGINTVILQRTHTIVMFVINEYVKSTWLDINAFTVESVCFPVICVKNLSFTEVIWRYTVESVLNTVMCIINLSVKKDGILRNRHPWYLCDVFNKSFNLKVSLRNHKGIHSGEGL